MLNKIFNWTVGSFFRTIGRVIAFLIIGSAIAYILSSNDIRLKLPSFLSIRVDALSLDGTPYGVQHVWSSLKQATFTASETSGTGDCVLNGYDNCYATKTYNFDWNITTPNSSIKYLVFTYWMGITNQNVDQLGDGRQNIIGFYIKATNGSQVGCEIQNNMIVCPVQSNLTYNGVVIRLILSGSNSQIMLNIHDYPTWYTVTTNQDITNSINNQTQQQQQQHQEVMNSTTTEAEEEASGFFEDFDTPDIGGLSAIITAPLNTIRSLLNSSCTNLVLPLPFVNEDLTLPCMNSIYTTNFGAFFSIYQTIVLALIAYRCIRSIFFDIHGFTNPNDDRIEVMDL